MVFSSCFMYYHCHAFSKAQKELLAQSREDQLTGLRNRRYLEERSNELLAKYKRDGKGFGIVF
ncbi:MAG: hypothetical protein R6U91_01005 [Bacillota bacterium]